MYIALIHKDPDSDYGVSFPDLPGCVSAGETVEEALGEARVALALHIEGMEEDGEEVPAPRSIEELMNDEEYADRRERAILATLVSPSPNSGVVTRINVSVDTGALAQIDKAAERQGVTRSRFLVASALEAAG